jgi:hypothetical protein
VHCAHGEHPVRTIYGAPIRTFYDDDVAADCVVCLDLDAVYEKERSDG